MTTIHEVREIIQMSMPEYWHNVTTAGGGPTYHDLMGVVGDYGFDHETHTSQAVYLSDVSLTVAWGLSPNEDDLTFDWAKFADPMVRKVFADVFWNNALVDRYVGVAVDGFRVTLPMPDLAATPEGSVEFFTEPSVSFFRLLHDLGGGGSDYDEYLGRTGLEIRR